MARLDAVTRYFATGTAEGDRPFLDNVFVSSPQLVDVLSWPAGTPRILVGNKGVGKTALLEWLCTTAGRQDIPALFMRPDDLDTSGVKDAADLGTLKGAMYRCILQGIAGTIGGRLSGFLTGDAAALYKTAIQSGHREPDYGTKVLQLLSAVSKPLTNVDAVALSNDLEKAAGGVRVREVVNRFLADEKRLMFLLFDDTDQVASPDKPEHLNRIWGLLLAVRKLAQECPGLRALVTLRLEVWLRLIHSGYGQRDQRDHFRPLVVNLRTNDAHMQAILETRLLLAASDAKIDNPGSVYAPFFDNFTLTLPMSDETRSWRSFLLKSSRERPRDMIQLVAHLTKLAVARGVPRITSKDAEDAMIDYSRERTEDLAGEMGEDCPVLLDVIRSFAGVPFQMTFEQVRAHLRKVPSRFGVIVRRITLQPDDDDDAIRLLAVLHESGFINPRVYDTDRDRNFRHILFLDDPGFVSKARWNEMQAVSWEVHPVFRSYLFHVEEEKDLRRPPPLLRGR